MSLPSLPSLLLLEEPGDLVLRPVGLPSAYTAAMSLGRQESHLLSPQAWLTWGRGLSCVWPVGCRASQGPGRAVMVPGGVAVPRAFLFP